MLFRQILLTALQIGERWSPQNSDQKRFDGKLDNDLAESHS